MPVRGQAGGIATFRKHGRGHMAAIGRVGFQSLKQKYFGGDREAAGTDHDSR